MVTVCSCETEGWCKSIVVFYPSCLLFRKLVPIYRLYQYLVIAYSMICTLKASLNLTNECLPRGEGEKGRGKRGGGRRKRGRLKEGGREVRRGGA